MAKMTEDGITVVELPARLVIETVAEVAAMLRQALAAGQGLRIVGSAVQQADLAGLQLLCAAHRAGIARQVDVTLDEPAERLILAAASAGYTGRKCMEPECLYHTLAAEATADATPARQGHGRELL